MIEGIPTAAEARFPQVRMRRLRSGATIRRMVRETRLSPDRLVLPLFAIAGRDASVPIDSLPGHARLSPDLLAATARRAWALGVPSVLLFGVTDQKDAVGQRRLRDRRGRPDGDRRDQGRRAGDAGRHRRLPLRLHRPRPLRRRSPTATVHNDLSLELLARTAISHAEAGADVVAPSDMMDGRVGAIRAALDAEGHEDTAIMAYSAKYASAFYGPFRDAAGSAPGFGDRRGYQMDPANGREAVRETLLDVAEGADMVMVKPAAAYLDVIAGVRAATSLPLAAYHVSGEYAMLKAAAERGWLDERQAATEVLTGIARAGADLLITYFAEDAARWIAEEGA